MVASILLNEVIRVPTSSWRRSKPDRAPSLPSSAPMRATMRPRSQITHAPASIPRTVNTTSNCKMPNFRVSLGPRVGRTRPITTKVRTRIGTTDDRTSATRTLLLIRWPARATSMSVSPGMESIILVAAQTCQCKNFRRVMGYIADRNLDCVGLFCPMPILKTRDALKAMAVGAGARDDLRRPGLGGRHEELDRRVRATSCWRSPGMARSSGSSSERPASPARRRPRRGSTSTTAASRRSTRAWWP